jgi:hypothetical protein
MTPQNTRWVGVALVAIAAGPVAGVLVGGGAGQLSVWAGAVLVFAVTGWLFMRSLPRS